MANEADQNTGRTKPLDDEDSLGLVSRGALKAGDVLASRYEIQQWLGTGGMASVYRAFDRVTEQTIAIKLLDPARSTGPAWVEHLGRELRHARRIKHPNVCQVFDFFEDEGRCFLTMELAPGGTLRAGLKAPPADRPLADRLADARAVIEGLTAIHEAGVVHRDLKPENVLRARDGRLMISDLGVAVRADLTTHSGGAAGTRTYMAPELFFGDKATKASDIWSLGIVLHELFFGCRPEWTASRKNRYLRVPAGVSGPLERRLLGLCTACLAESPEDRLRDGAAARRRFEGILRGWIQLTWRVPVMAVAAASLAVALVLTLGGRERVSRPSSFLVGTAVDLATDSVPVFSTNRMLRGCGQLLPGDRSTLRLFFQSSPEAIDLDVETGRYTPSKLVPEALGSGCAQLAPDGRRLLYERMPPGRVPQVMLSESPDGRDAAPITDGEGPYWLPSGDAFLYTVDYNRSAVFWIGHGPVQFATNPVGNQRVTYHALNERGDEVAVLFSRSFPDTGHSLDIYRYPQTDLLRSIRLPWETHYRLQNDPGRKTWQISMRDPERFTLCEVNEDGKCQRLLKSADADVAGSYRTRVGLVAITGRMSSSSRLTDRAGRTQDYLRHYAIDFTPSGDAVMGLPLADGRLVVAVQRRGEAKPRIVSDGPLDLSPSFGPEGKSFIYVGKEGAKSVIQCPFDGQPSDCHVIHREPLVPSGPRLSPDGAFLSYLVREGGGPRMKIVPMRPGGPTRDLSIPGSGTHLWTSPSRLWLCETVQKQWEEVDAVAGIRTGRTLPFPEHADKAYGCWQPPPSVAAHFADFEVTTRSEITQEIRLVRGL